MIKFRKYLPWFIIVIGIFLRVSEYLHNRSLWVDETFIALNIIHKSYSQLMGHLDYLQHAPFSFLWIEKFIAQWFGTGEYALRLFPLLCGVISLGLFYLLSRMILRPLAAFAAVAIFSLSDLLIYYSSEVKQYSMDVVVALVLYLYFIPLIGSKSMTKRNSILALVVGLAAILSSQPSIFILCGIGSAWSIEAFLSKNKKLTIQSLLLLAGWLVGFSIYYILFIRGYFSDTLFLTYWQYVVLVPTKLSEFIENASGILTFFTSLLGNWSGVIGLILCAVGLTRLIRQQRAIGLMLVLPMGFTWIASGFHAYPFAARLFLFWSPAVILGIASGVYVLFQKLQTTESIFGKVSGWIMVGGLFVGPLITAAGYQLHPREVEEFHPIMRYYKDHVLPTDTTYVYYAGVAPYRYYGERLGLEKTEYTAGIMSRDNWQAYEGDLTRILGKARVWIVFSHVIIAATRANGEQITEEQYMTKFLDSHGKKLDEVHTVGSSLYLYDVR